LDKAGEMCKNYGHCRKFDAGTMCPSYRATRDEVHLTRGRANTLRLALSGQLGPDSDSQVKEALDLCVSCKGCKRECPTGVDMARMKIEFKAQYRTRHGLALRERAIAYLPRYASLAADSPFRTSARWPAVCRLYAEPAASWRDAISSSAPGRKAAIGKRPLVDTPSPAILSLRMRARRSVLQARTPSAGTSTGQAVAAGALPAGLG
jgi:ferredoxin